MKRKLVLSVLILGTLVGCGSFSISAVSTESGGGSTTEVPTSAPSSVSDSSSQSQGVNYYRPSSLNLTLQDINSQVGWVTSESTGDQKMLVVPVKLKDGPAWTTTKLENLRKAFFGKSEETTFESVASFYEKSSYGELRITGEIAPVCELNTSDYTVSKVNSLGDYAADTVIAEYYKTANASLLKQYDLNNDGFVDNCIFIYSNAYSTSDTSGFWAWCSYTDMDPSSSKPAVNNYMWASYEFMNDGYEDNYRSDYIDAHTFIHETGHLLGLDDYYSYESGGWDCAGTLEMQSYNVGDQNIYSKMALGWVKPYVVTGNSEITLKTSAKYPEAILINDTWNGSAFDEYILIEYYTPQGLNQVDAEHTYGGRDKMYGYKGLRIYHIDARLAKLSVDSRGNITFKGYTDTIVTSNNMVSYVGASNTPSYSYLSGSFTSLYRYVHLLDQGGSNRLNAGKGGTVSKNTALWTGSKTFSPSSTFFANGTRFNGGEDIGYSVSVSNLTDESCKVTITKA